MSKRTLYFLRHGESDWNVARLCIGQLDRPLTDRGRAQALAAGARCRSLGVELIFHSPLSRAADTAHAISQATGARQQVEPDPPPKKWTGLSRSALGLGWTDVAQG